MYWVYGAPRVFASTNAELAPELQISSDDDVKTHARSADEIESPQKEQGAESKLANLNEASNEAPPKPEASGKPGSAGSRVNGSGASEGLQPLEEAPGDIIALRLARSGQVFATITRSTLKVWQTKPTAVLASITRSTRSLSTYGHNVALLVRPDSSFIAVQTRLGFLVLYSLETEAQARLYKSLFAERSTGYSRRHNNAWSKAVPGAELCIGPGETGGVREIDVRFRMVIRVDAGISRALALDDELVIATEKPAAIQCIRWPSERGGSQTSTELLSRMPWLERETKPTILEMVHDRPMNLSTWITSDGRAYAVQRLVYGDDFEAQAGRQLFKGYCFHSSKTSKGHAAKATINARFSLVAIGCSNGDICVYTARDYTGNIPLSHTLKPSGTGVATGALKFLTYSPDGYCLFAGYENGWMTWSVYGKPIGNSLAVDRISTEANSDHWPLGTREGFWLGGGCQLLLLPPRGSRLWVLEFARSAVTGCFCAANVARALLQTNTGFMVYRGYDVPDLSTISGESALWHHVQIPTDYVTRQWPIRSAVISSDGRYIAVAGRRGLAHFSVTSGRWRTFDDPLMEDEFTVRGGMCWHQHVLIAAVEVSQSYELRIFSREQALDSGRIMHIEQLPAPIVLLTPSGEDSLLVYTYENILYHYTINVSNRSVKLVQVGQIALHGIIRAPLRVRAVSWILPEDQLDHGDPSQDVTVATVLFLVDGKLVLLQPATSDSAELKYEMRIIAQNVEYYALMRGQPSFSFDNSRSLLLNGDAEVELANGFHGHDLRESLWYFDGQDMRLWTDLQDVLATASPELGRDIPPSVQISVDFYPLSVLLNKGILFGVESELFQRRDMNFAAMRFATRTHLFLPPLLRHHLVRYDSPAALHLSHQYQHLDYFTHALEILLHDILDEEVDAAPPADQALLPGVLSFLSSFSQYLDIVVQCTRKTEVRSWRTLFAHLPPPQELFEESLARGSLKTAGGYLLVLHNLDELSEGDNQLVRLMRRAQAENDWEISKELARFLMAFDETGAALQEALDTLEVESPVGKKGGGPLGGGDVSNLRREDVALESAGSSASGPSPASLVTSEDYFA